MTCPNCGNDLRLRKGYPYCDWCDEDFNEDKL